MECQNIQLYSVTLIQVIHFNVSNLKQQNYFCRWCVNSLDQPSNESHFDPSFCRKFNFNLYDIHKIEWKKEKYDEAGKTNDIRVTYDQPQWINTQGERRAQTLEVQASKIYLKLISNILGFSQINDHAGCV